MDRSKVRNMEEFAAKCGVSRPTVSKYFNDPDSVRAKTRNLIEEALERYNYRPNIYAINQNRSLTKNIGIVVPYLADPFFAEIARKIENLIIDAGFRPIMLSSHGDPAQEIENLESLRSIKPAGVLMAPLGRASDRKVLEAFCGDVPTVLFDSNIDDVGEAFCGHDNEKSTSLIVDYLCRTGQPPAFYEMREPTNPNAYKRRSSYLKTIDRLGHSPHLVQVEGQGWDFEEIGYRGGMKALAGGDLSSQTILCSNDRLAIGFLAAAYETGLPVGHGEGCAMRVAGHDDHPFSRFTCPSLTTVAQDYEAISNRSVETLLSLIEGGGSREPRTEIQFEGKLVLRASA